MNQESLYRIRACIGVIVRFVFGAGLGILVIWAMLWRARLSGYDALLAYGGGGLGFGLLTLIVKDTVWTTLGDSPLWRYPGRRGPW